MLKWPLILLVKFYRLAISPLLGPRCRFYPTCSEYALIALHHHGAMNGGWLAIKRIARCHPGCEGGIDPVPDVPYSNDDNERDSADNNPDCTDEAHPHDDR